MQPVLGRLFEFILKNFHDVDLRDRTYYFYNLMQKDIALAEHIICGEKATLDYIYDEIEGDYMEKIYSQFNSLSIVYQKPEEKFIKAELLNGKENEKALIEKEDTPKDEGKQIKTNTNSNADLLVRYIGLI